MNDVKPLESFNDGHTHVIVFSHRRSGTHLTMDAIRNNFPYYEAEYINLDRIGNSKHPEAHTLEELKAKLKAAPRVLKSHCLPGWRKYKKRPEVQTFLQELTGRSKKIYVCRNCFDVMVSLYEFRKTFDEAANNMSFKEFLQSPRPEGDGLSFYQYWSRHVGEWLQVLNKDYALVRFEDLFMSYQAVISGIATYLEVEAPALLKDVRVKKSVADEGEYNYTDLEFTQGARNGMVGDYVNYFDKSDFEAVLDVVKPLHKIVGYDFQIEGHSQ